MSKEIAGKSAKMTAQDGVQDMTVLSNIDEHGINTNLRVRYESDRIYVSKLNSSFICGQYLTRSESLEPIMPFLPYFPFCFHCFNPLNSEDATL